ncbi:hypothetical protein ECHLIB_0560 [Ehrlichia chaffeensis str. Liberty]|uniref:hypothetical protein n=1 Tax=Ehrlichia chaffeensis TaxID=945 RepID=UPI000444D294|nr:hypothetical protein [Ehrlichia chaffeensis]AHX06612.1 hypothetical protein ECHLIB_0560 [Ehrlichia chaffeensis str. Liberty]
MLNFNKTLSKYYSIVACIAFFMLLVLLIVHLIRVFLKKESVIGHLVTGILALSLLSIIVVFGSKYLSDHLEFKNKLLVDLFTEEHKEKVEVQQIGLNEDFERSIMRLLELKKLALEDISVDFAESTQHSQSILEKYDREIEHLEALQRRQVEIIELSNSLGDKFQLQGWEYDTSLKHIQDNFIEHIKHERYSHYCFCCYLHEFEVGDSVDFDELSPRVSSAMIYITSSPPITCIFKSAGTLLTAMGKLDADDNTLFVEYCQRLYNFDCKMALQIEISLSNRLKCDSYTYNHIDYWINSTRSYYRQRDTLAIALQEGKHLLTSLADREYSDTVSSFKSRGIESTISQLENTLNTQLPKGEIDKIIEGSNPIMQKIVRELNFFGKDRMETLNNVQSELPETLLGRKIIDVIEAEEELKSLIDKKYNLGLEDGPKGKIRQMMCYLQSRFDEVKDGLLAYSPMLSQDISQIQALLDLDLKSSPLNLQFEGQPLNLEDVETQITYLSKRLFREEEDQIELLQCVQDAIQCTHGKMPPDLEENFLLKSLDIIIKYYSDFLQGIQTVFSNQSVAKDEVVYCEHLLNTKSASLQKIFDILYTRYQYLEENYCNLEEASLKLSKVQTLNAQWLVAFKNVEHVHILFEKLLKLESQYSAFQYMVTRLQELMEAVLGVRDGSSYLHLLDISEDEKSSFLAELSQQKEPIELLKLLSMKKVEFSMLKSEKLNQLDGKVQAISKSLFTFIDKRDEILVSPIVVQHLFNEGRMGVHFISKLEKLKGTLTLLSNETRQLIFGEYVNDIDYIIDWIRGAVNVLYNNDNISVQKGEIIKNYLEYLQQNFLIHDKLLNLFNLKKEIKNKKESLLPILDKLKIALVQNEELDGELVNLKKEIDDLICQVNRQMLLIIEKDGELKEFVELVSGLLNRIDHKDDIPEFLYCMEIFDDSLAKLERGIDCTDDKENYTKYILENLRNISRLSSELKAKQTEKLPLGGEQSELIEELVSIGQQVNIKDQLSVLDDLYSFLDVAKYLQEEFNSLYKEAIESVLEIVDVEEEDKNSLVKLVNNKLKSLGNSFSSSEVVSSFMHQERQDVSKLGRLESYISILKEEPNNLKQLADQLLKFSSFTLPFTGERLHKTLQDMTTLNTLYEVTDYLKTYISKSRYIELDQLEGELRKFVEYMINTVKSILPPLHEYEKSTCGCKSCQRVEQEMTLYFKIANDLDDLQSLLQQERKIITFGAIQKFQEICKNMKSMFLEDKDLVDSISNILLHSEHCKKMLGLDSYTTHFLLYIKFLIYSVIEVGFSIEQDMVMELNVKIYRQEVLVSELKANLRKELDENIRNLLDQPIYYPKDLINVRLIKRRFIDNGIIFDDLMKILEDSVKEKVQCSSSALVSLMCKERIDSMECLIDTYQSEKVSYSYKLKLYTAIQEFMDNSVDQRNIQYLKEIDDGIRQVPNVLLFCPGNILLKATDIHAL